MVLKSWSQYSQLYTIKLFEKQIWFGAYIKKLIYYLGSCCPYHYIEKWQHVKTSQLVVVISIGIWHRWRCSALCIIWVLVFFFVREVVVQGHRKQLKLEWANSKFYDWSTTVYLLPNIYCFIHRVVVQNCILIIYKISILCILSSVLIHMRLQTLRLVRGPLWKLLLPFKFRSSNIPDKNLRLVL